MQRIEKPIMPGEKLDGVVQTLNISYWEFALKGGMEPWGVCQIVNGKRRITTRWAVALAKATGISAKQWLTWQIEWDLWKLQNQGVET